MDFFCVIVTYNPNIEEFKKVMDSILKNTTNYLIVDNNSSNIKEISYLVGNKIKKLNENCGIAKAQNIGIEEAKKAGTKYVWLSDQDTIYPKDYLFKMLISIKKLEDKNIKFAVIGPSFIDKNRNEIQPFNNFSLLSKEFYSNGKILEVRELIASGMIIPIKVLSHICHMKEELFIDYVDFEWCWRARSKGYKIIGNGNVTIEHILGDKIINLFWKKMSLRSPFRHYFIVRNGIYLSLNCKYLNKKARLKIIIRSLIYTFLYPLLAKKDKVIHLKATFKGLYHGFVGKLGKMS